MSPSRLSFKITNLSNGTTIAQQRQATDVGRGPTKLALAQTCFGPNLLWPEAAAAFGGARLGQETGSSRSFGEQALGTSKCEVNVS